MTRSAFHSAKASTIALMLLIPLVLGLDQSFRADLPAPAAALVAVGVKAGQA
jgi:hypothetical protein